MDGNTLKTDDCMNWRTKELVAEAKASISDDGVFSPDQNSLLREMIDVIANAIDRESECNKPSVNL